MFATVTAAALWCALVPADAVAAEALLLPGVDVRDVEFTPGKWCRYLVIDEAEGFNDTSVIYVAVREIGDLGGEAVAWVEFESGRLGAPDEDRDVSLVAISMKIKEFADGDSLYHYVRRLYIRKGDQPVEPADPRSLQRLSITSPTSETNWVRTADVAVSTPAGSYVCEHKALTVDDSKERDTGNVTVILRKMDRFDIWSAPEVPIFGLAKCVIGRSRETRTEPKIPGIPDPGPRESRTTTILIEHGDNAEPLITLQ